MAAAFRKGIPNGIPKRSFLDKEKGGPNLDQTPRPTFRYLIDFDGAGDRDRTGDIQLGKLTFYH
jgi:hypothetical protein